MSPGWKTFAYQNSFCMENCHWPSWQRCTSEKIQRHFEKVPGHMQHWLPPADQINCRHTVYQATTSSEVKRRANMEDKRRRRKNQDFCEINTGQIVTCSRCGKACLSQIGFISRQRACTRSGLPPSCIFVREAESWWWWCLLIIHILIHVYHWWI